MGASTERCENLKKVCARHNSYTGTVFGTHGKFIILSLYMLYVHVRAKTSSKTIPPQKHAHTKQNVQKLSFFAPQGIFIQYRIENFGLVPRNGD